MEVKMNTMKKPDFIRSNIIALLMNIETQDGKIRHITHNLIKDMNLFEYRDCDFEYLKFMITNQIPDHTLLQLEVLCDLAWYGSDYQAFLGYLNPASGHVSDFRGGWADRAFEGKGSTWIIGQYAISALKAEASKKKFPIGPTVRDWSRIVAAYLKTPHWSDDFVGTGLSFSELIDKCDDQQLLAFLGQYEGLAEDQSFEAVYKWEHQNNPERLWTNFSPEAFNNRLMEAEFTKTTPEYVELLAVLKNGFVIEKSNPDRFSKAA